MRKISSLVGKIFLATLLGYTFLGFFLIPYFVQFYLPVMAKKTFHTESYIDSVHFNPFSFEIKLSNFMLKDEQQNNLIFFETLKLNFNPSKLLQKEISLSYLTLDNAKVFIQFDKNKKANFQYILDILEKNSTQSDTKNQYFLYLENLDISNLNFVFEDLSKQKPFILKTKPINLLAKSLKTLPNHINQIALEIDTFETGKINLTSNIVVEPLELSGYLALENIAVNQLFEYLKPQDVAFDIDSSPLNLKLNYHYNQNLSIKNMVLDLEKFLFDMDKFQIKGENFRNHTDNLSVQFQEPLHYEINDINTTSSIIAFVDKEKNISLDFKKFENFIHKVTQNQSLPISIQQTFQTPKSGTLASQISVTPSPLQIEGKVQTKALNLTAYQRYIDDFLNIDFHSGTLTNSSDFVFSNENNETNITLNFNGTLENIAIKNSLNNQKLVKIGTLDISKLQLDKNHLSIDTISINQPYVYLNLNDNNTTNFTNLVKHTNKSKTTPTKEENFSYKINKINIQNGSSTFEDYTITPHFISHDEKIEGDILNLSSNTKEKTVITHKSIIDKYALLNMKADMVISDPLQFTKSNIVVENIDLPSLSSYSGKFIGNKIATGKLHLTLEYEIENSQLQSKNHIKIKDLKLGEKVESKEAIKAPIGLAIALLKDNEGYIDLDIPISGDINDPKFHLSDVILDVITNTLVGIVSAPFKFLGLLLGISGDDISQTYFEYGSFTISNTQQESLDGIIKAFEKRPNLELQINPTYVTKEDTQALQNQIFKTTNPLFFDDKIEFEKRFTLAQTAYIKQFNEESYKNLQGTKDEKYPQMVIALQTNIIITPVELETLATQRANAIQEYLTTKGLQSERIKINTNFQPNGKDTRMDKVVLKFELSSK